MKKVRAKQFPLRLPRTLKEAARVLSASQGVSMNHFISIAVAEKISRLESQEQRDQSTPMDAETPESRLAG